MRTKIVFTLIAVLACATAACGGGDKKDGPTAPDQCWSLTETFCQQIADCELSEGKIKKSEHDGFYNDCVDEFGADASCSNAVAVDHDNYPTCVDGIQKLECKALLSAVATDTNILPGACTGVIKVN
jgi:hypothetical protein